MTRRAQRPPDSRQAPPGAESAGRVGVLRRVRRWWPVLGVAAVLAVAMPVVLLAVLLPSSGAGKPEGPPRAVIVDQLSLTYPNPAFVERATVLLEQGGYAVDYVPGEDVTIDFYRGLPERGYDYVLLRVHTAQLMEEWRGLPHDEAVLFTSEPYSSELYLYEQWEAQLNPAFTYEGALRYFAVAANFVESAMEGDFDGATVIMMGCGGLHTERTAEAFVRRGAGVVLGWDHLVSASHTDQATERLLEKLLVEDLPLPAALAQTMDEVGADPAYKSLLLSYPPES